jgi:hypothetical protein
MLIQECNQPDEQGSRVAIPGVDPSSVFSRRAFRSRTTGRKLSTLPKHGGSYRGKGTKNPNVLRPTRQCEIPEKSGLCLRLEGPAPWWVTFINQIICMYVCGQAGVARCISLPVASRCPIAVTTTSAMRNKNKKQREKGKKRCGHSHDAEHPTACPSCMINACMWLPAHPPDRMKRSQLTVRPWHVARADAGSASNQNAWKDRCLLQISAVARPWSMSPRIELSGSHLLGFRFSALTYRGTGDG